MAVRKFNVHVNTAQKENANCYLWLIGKMDYLKTYVF